MIPGLKPYRTQPRNYGLCFGELRRLAKRYCSAISRPRAVNVLLPVCRLRVR